MCARSTRVGVMQYRRITELPFHLRNTTLIGSSSGEGAGRNHISDYATISLYQVCHMLSSHFAADFQGRIRRVTLAGGAPRDAGSI